MTPRKPRVRILRHEFNRSTGKTEPIWEIVFPTDPVERAAVEEWLRCHPNFGDARGQGIIDNKKVSGKSDTAPGDNRL